MANHLHRSTTVDRLLSFENILIKQIIASDEHL
jgi:hypothetical protein